MVGIGAGSGRSGGEAGRKSSAVSRQSWGISRQRAAGGGRRKPGRAPADVRQGRRTLHPAAATWVPRTSGRGAGRYSRRPAPRPAATTRRPATGVADSDRSPTPRRGGAPASAGWESRKGGCEIGISHQRSPTPRKGGPPGGVSTLICDWQAWCPRGTMDASGASCRTGLCAMAPGLWFGVRRT